MINKRPKIAVIGLKGLPAFGGAAAVGENIIEQLTENYYFTVYSISSHTNFHTGKYKQICHQIVFRSIPFKKLNSLYYYLLSAIHVLFKNYDLIHLHHRDAAFIIPLLRMRYKVILTIHGYGTEDLSDKWSKFRLYYLLQERFFIKFANRITTMSKHEQKKIRNHYAGHVDYIPNGVSVSNFIENYRKDYILFVAGRIVSFKRCDILLQSLINMEYKGKLIIIGDIDQTKDYKEKILELSSKLPHVEFKGLIKDKNELNKYYQKAKLFVFPSFREAMSMVLLEAASKGVPIIASRIEGNTQIFSSKEVLFFEVDDVQNLSEKIIWAMNNYDKMLEKSLRAVSKLNINYTWSNIAQKYKSVYQTYLQ